MRRIQIYLDESLWEVLRERAQEGETSVSELLRRAVRERYMNGLEESRMAMQGLVGLWKDRQDIRDAETHLRNLRRSTRKKRAKNR